MDFIIGQSVPGQVLINFTGKNREIQNAD